MLPVEPGPWRKQETPLPTRTEQEFRLRVRDATGTVKAGSVIRIDAGYRKTPVRVDVR